MRAGRGNESPLCLSMSGMLRAHVSTGLLIALVLSAIACGQPSGGASSSATTPPSTPTTIVMIVTVPPVPTLASPTPAPRIAAPPPAPPGPEQVLRLNSDGVTSPPAFRLAGGSYLFSWEVPRPTKEGGCFFSAMLTSEPSVSPFILQSLGPWTVAPTAGHAGSRRLDGLGAGGYSLRPTGDCPWTITITPIPGI
jgi:hypothetical protein